jgi:hypothetical protein
MGPRKQRDVMRELVKRHGMNRDVVVAAYARAERNGDVKRERNTHGTDPETYARALWADGVTKGWL